MLTFVAAGLISACGGEATPPPEVAPPPPPASEAPPPKPEPAPEPAAEAPKPAPRTIEVKLEAKSGSKLAGKATLSEVEGGVKVALSVEGVKPGDHGAHVHEKGDCSAPDGASAGGHFNPGGHDHALPTNDKRHLGDLGNLSVAKDGKGSLEITIPGANLKSGDASSFAGKAIIIHDKKDDGGQPVGNAGGRIGCGVIES
jgi:Cu-Zn family superoxide dismutase